MWPFRFPYTNFHELNLDWILEKVSENARRISANELKIKLIGGDDPLNSLHPVGSLYLSVNETSPAALFGGTWELFARDKFLIGAGGTYAIEAVGGENTHTLTVDEIPAHSHFVAGSVTGEAPLSSGYFTTSTVAGATNNWGLETNPSGNGVAHNNMPPFIAVNIWKRVG